MNEEQAKKAFEKLVSCLPPIGFLSRKKRIFAYLVVTTNAQQMIDYDEINEAEALFVLSMLMRKNKNFQKAGMMAALNLSSLDESELKPIGFKYANEIRKNLKLAVISHTNSQPSDDCPK
jgi:hypothetical protein